MPESPRPNRQQQAVIDHLEGPLRVIAGAGTGKTRTLTWRIQAILENRLARPGQILALTFTEKAAAELRERIDAATLAFDRGNDRVAVHTYHSFGASVVNEFGHLLELPPEPLLLSEAEKWILIWRSINEIAFRFIDYGNLRPNMHSGSSEIGNMLKLSSRLSDELQTLDDLRNFLASMPADADEVAKLSDYAHALEVYESKKQEAGAIDFGDQIAFAVELLQHPDVASIVHERFRFVMVDEFQDTNYAQAVMVRLLTSPEQQNVCVVGDPNQSIYLFRGASPDNLQRFATVDFPDALTLSLSENYRSYQSVLDAANAIWLDASDGATRGMLSSGRDKNGPKPAFVTTPFKSDEINWVADEIGRLIETEQARPEEIMVLARSNERKLEFWRALAERHIPAIAIGGDALFELPEVQEIVSWLKAIIDRNNNEAFLHLLMLDRWGLDERDIFAWTTGTDSHDPLSERIEHFASSGAAPPPLVEFLDTLDHLTGTSYQVSLTQLAEQAIDMRQGAYTPDERRSLTRFLEIINQFSSARVGNPTLTDLIEYLDLLQMAGGEEIDLAVEDVEDAVQVMTTHKAKGLEKKVVFVVCSYAYKGGKLDDLLPPDLAHEIEGRPERPLTQVDKESYDAFGKVIDAWRKQVGEAEEQRVFYVAVTRAEDRLYVTRSVHINSPGQSKKLPEFVTALAEECDQLEETGASENEPGLPFASVIKTALIEANLDFESPRIETEIRQVLFDPWIAEGGDPATFDDAMSQFLESRQPLLDELDMVNAIEQRRIERLADRTDPQRRDFSYSALDQYQKCPHRFYLRYQLGLPGRPSTGATAFGSRFHEAVQREAERRRAGLPPEPVDIVSARLNGEHSGNTLASLRAPSSGNDPLQAYLKSPDATAEPLLIEKDFVLSVGESRIHGVIDRVQRLPDGTIEIVDYKTNRQTSSADEVKSGLQLPIYLLAVRECFPEIQPAPNQAKMFFVRHNEPVTVSYSNEELAAMRVKLAQLCIAAANVTSEAHHASIDSCCNCDFRDACRFAIKT